MIDAVTGEVMGLTPTSWSGPSSSGRNIPSGGNYPAQFFLNGGETPSN
jgi:hypothetical protein